MPVTWRWNVEEIGVKEGLTKERGVYRSRQNNGVTSSLQEGE